MGLAEDIKKKKRNGSPATITIGDIQKVTSLADRIKLKQAAGLIAKPEQIQEPQKEGFLKSTGKTIIKPFAELGTGLLNLGEATYKFAKKDYAGASQSLEKKRGGYDPAFTGKETGLEMAKKVGGYGLEIGSYLPFGAAVKGIGLAAKAGGKLLPKIGTGALKGAVEGGIGGGMMGAATPLRENQGFGEVLKGGATGALMGTAFGGALGGVSPVVGAGVKAGFKKVAPKTLFPKTAALRAEKEMTNTVAKREEEIFNIENNYAKTRKAMSYSKDANSASRKRIASTDVLVGAVDQDGLIRTENAVKQYRAMTLEGTEGVVRQNLEREGGSVTADIIKKQLQENIMKSGLEGKALQRALTGIDAEINGLMLRADSSGRIPLAVLQDAKISAYGGINFQSEPWVKTEQKTIANAYKKLIEGNSNVRITIGNKTYGIKDINEELGKYLKDIELLENLNGRRVKGGKLGKYFSQISGNIVGGIAGHAIGGPAGSAVGTIIGGELGGRLRGNILSKTLGKATGNLAPESQILKEAAITAESPRLMLPAPKSIFRSQMPTGPTINLPSKTQSAIDEAYSKSLGKRNQQYNPTKITTTATSIKKEVKPRFKSKKVAPRLKTNIAKEAKASGQSFERAKNLSSADRKIEDAAFKKIESQQGVILKDYARKNGKYVNADNMRSIFVKEGYNGTNAAAVQEPVSYLAKQAFTNSLKNEGKYATYSSGMSGAGKTTALKQIPRFGKIESKSSVVLDSNLSNLNSALKKFAEAEKAGKKNIVFYTYRELMDGLVNGVIKRMIENPSEMGRIVPTKIIAENAPGSLKVAQELQNRGYKVYVVDNSLGKNKAKLSSFDEILKKADYSGDLKIKLDNKVKQLYGEGKLTPEQFRAYTE